MLLAVALAESGAPWNWHVLGDAQIGHSNLCPEALLVRLSWVQVLVSCAIAQPRSACQAAQQCWLTIRQGIHTVPQGQGPARPVSVPSHEKATTAPCYGSEHRQLSLACPLIAAHWLLTATPKLMRDFHCRDEPIQDWAPGSCCRRAADGHTL